MIEPPQDVSFGNHISRLVGVSFLHPSSVLQASDLIRMTEALNPGFDESYLLSINPNQCRYEAFARILALPPWRGARDGDASSLYLIKEQIAFGHFVGTELQSVIQSRITSHPVIDSTCTKKALAVFDYSVFPGNPIFLQRCGAFELIDHFVFVVQTDPGQLECTYELIRSCLAVDHTLRGSILLVGRGAEALWELIYERFSAIVSQFMGCHLGFLGWIENDRMQLNGELLLEGEENPLQLFAKMQLIETLDDFRLASSPAHS